ncbi:MAG: hypothetical protein ACI8RA_000097, partial [Chlamydiales bacterium]
SGSLGVSNFYLLGIFCLKILRLVCEERLI